MPRDTTVDVNEVIPVSTEDANVILSQTKVQMMTLDHRFNIADCDGGPQICMWLPLPDMDLTAKTSSSTEKAALKATLKAGQLSWKATVKALVALREKQTGIKPLHLCVTFTKSGPKLVFAKGPEPKGNKHSHGSRSHVIKVDPKLKGKAKKGARTVTPHVHP